MLQDTILRWETIERWSPRMFFAGGMLMAAHATMMGIQAFTSMATPPDVFAPTGSLLVFVGVFGIYRSVSERAPTASHVGAGCVGLAVVGFSVIAVGNAAELGGVVPPDWVAIFAVLALVGAIPGFLAFGVASLHAKTHPRRVGVLLMAPAGLFLSLIVSVLVLEASAIGGLFVGSGLALTYLMLGYSLRPGSASAVSVPPVSEVAAG